MKYPALNKLGISRPQEVSSYSLTSQNHMDTLRVRYARQPGSVLPVSKRFQFPRRPVAGPQTEPGRPLETVLSPALAEVLDELTALLENKETVIKQKTDILQEIEELENYMRSRFEELKKDITEMPS